MNCQDLHTIEGLQFMPVKANKQPIIKGWQTSAEKHDLSNCIAVGLVCGKLSGNLECVDIDLKYDLTGKIYETYKRLINEIDSTLLGKLVVQQTKSGGYHFIYRCSVIAGNLKLANRRTTEQERQQTYQDSYQNELSKSTPDDKARAIAAKASENDKVRVLFETRGEGGQIVCFPTSGYKIVYGDWYSINEITPEQREVLHGIAMQFNEVVEEQSIPLKRMVYDKKNGGLSVFDDYNQRADVCELLQQHGWKFVSQKGQKSIFLRPGQATSQTSGNFDHSKNWFSVFTTSTEFEPQKAYLPYAVFAVLECNKDYAAAHKRLLGMGYGEPAQEKKQPTESTRAIKSRVNPDDEDFSFLAKPADYEEYLQQVRDGTLKQGLTTGSPYLDEFFLFKEGNLVMTNGHDNTGKSVFTWWLLLLAAMYHGWKGIIFSSENTLGAFMRKMIQFYWGKSLHGKYAMSDGEYQIAKKFIEGHFALIKAQEDLYNYKDIINMVKKARKSSAYHYGMIDPYNSLKIDLSGFSKLSTHEYHYEALSEIKSYGQQNNFGWFVNHHAVTAALRAKDGEKKYPVAPQKADTEGGGKVSNKADDFITIHRITQHPTDWMVTELHVRKIKDTETGGRVTPIDSPVKFEMYKGGCAFIERREDGVQAIDPIHNWHVMNGTIQQELYDLSTQITNKPTNGHSKVIDINGWMPFKDSDFNNDETPF
jgi:hypothetical protein